MAMKPTTLCIVIGHGAQQAVFDRHLPLWKRHNLPILVCCPSDDPIITTHVLLTGKSSFNGPDTAIRWINLLTRFVATGYKNAVLFEYDSLCLKDSIIVLPGLHGIIQANTEPKRFLAPRFVNAPWTLDAESAMAMLKVAKRYPDLIEEGADDRMLSAWAWLANVPVLSHAEPGFSANTIQQCHWPYILGARWLHGIKDAKTLNFILGT